MAPRPSARTRRTPSLDINPDAQLQVLRAARPHLDEVIKNLEKKDEPARKQRRTLMV